MEPRPEPVERADAATFTVSIPATGSRIRIRRIGTQVRAQGAR